jgi:hypothetical protein
MEFSFQASRLLSIIHGINLYVNVIDKNQWICKINLLLLALSI